MNTLNKIQNSETGVNQIENFISSEECKELLEYFRNLKNKSIGKNQSVEREESTKIFFDFGAFASTNWPSAGTAKRNQ